MLLLLLAGAGSQAPVVPAPPRTVTTRARAAQLTTEARDRITEAKTRPNTTTGQDT